MAINPKANAKNTLDNTKPQINRFQLASTASPNSNQKNGDVNLYIRQGYDLFRAGNYSEAIEVVNQAIKIQPDNSDAYFLRGASYHKLKQYQQAKVDFDKCINRNNSYSFAYLTRGITNYQLGDVNSAITDLQTAANLFKTEGDTKMLEQSLDIIKKIRNV